MIKLINELIVEPFKDILNGYREKIRKIKIAMTVLYIAVMLNLFLTTVTLIIVSIK